MLRNASLALSLALFALQGCQSTPASAATGKTVDQAAGKVEACIGHLDATLAALEAMVKTPAPDLGPQFKAYSKSLGKLESSADEVAELAARMDTRSKEYFEQWDGQLATVQNESIRERSADRRAVVAASFQKVQSEYTEVHDEFQPLLANLRDIHTALTADLTLEGLRSIEKPANGTVKEFADVKQSLLELAANFHELGQKLSANGPPAQPDAK